MKYQRFTPSGSKNIEFLILVFTAKTEFIFVTIVSWLTKKNYILLFFFSNYIDLILLCISIIWYLSYKLVLRRFNDQQLNLHKRICTNSDFTIFRNLKLNSFKRWNNLSLTCQRFTPASCKDKGIRKFDFFRKK